VVVSIVFVVYSIDSKVTMTGERKIGRVLKKKSDLIEVLYRRRIEESLNISPMITCAPYKVRLPKWLSRTLRCYALLAGFSISKSCNTSCFLLYPRYLIVSVKEVIGQKMRNKDEDHWYCHYNRALVYVLADVCWQNTLTAGAYRLCVVGYNKAYRTERKSIERQIQGTG